MVNRHPCNRSQLEERHEDSGCRNFSLCVLNFGALAFAHGPHKAVAMHAALVVQFCFKLFFSFTDQIRQGNSHPPPIM